MRRFLTASVVAGLVLLVAPPSTSSALDAVTVEITAPAAGATVARTITVKARTTATAAIGSVAFAWSSSDGATWRRIAVDDDPHGDTWSVRWPTRPFTGRAKLRARAFVQGMVGGSDAEAVHVDNTPPRLDLGAPLAVFSPNHDGRKDAARLIATVNERADLSIEVLDAGGNTVAKPIEGRNVDPGRSSVVWNGYTPTETGWARVGEGGYRARAIARDAAGNRSRSVVALRVDTTPPHLRWVSLTPRRVTSTDAMRFTYRAADRSAPMRVAVLVSGVESGKESRIARIRMTGLASGLRSREWAPASHGEPLEPGSYNARLRATDAAGNTSLSRRSPFRDERPVQAKVYSSFEGVGRRVAVTFDDCAFESAWSDILDVLRRFHVKATFFCNGTNVSRYPELARRTVAAGMGIGSHTRSHPDLRTVSSSEIVAQVRYDEDIWWQVARITPAPYFRPPYGAYDQHVLDAVGRVGFARTMLWDVDPQDWRRPGASEVARRILSHAHPGMVTLLHVIPESVAAVPLVLRGLERRGLHQVSLDEMLHAAGP